MSKTHVMHEWPKEEEKEEKSTFVFFQNLVWRAMQQLPALLSQESYSRLATWLDVLQTLSHLASTLAHIFSRLNLILRTQSWDEVHDVLEHARIRLAQDVHATLDSFPESEQPLEALETLDGILKDLATSGPGQAFMQKFLHTLEQRAEVILTHVLHLALNANTQESVQRSVQHLEFLHAMEHMLDAILHDFVLQKLFPDVVPRTPQQEHPNKEDSDTQS